LLSIKIEYYQSLFLHLTTLKGEMLQKTLNKYKSWILFVVLGIIWGSSFILMKKGLFASDGTSLLKPDELALFRLIIAMLSLLPIVLIYIKRLDAKYWKYLIIVGVFGNGIPAFLFTYAQTEVSSSLAGILNSTVPFFTLVLGSAAFSLKTNSWNRWGVLVGFAGTIIIIIGGQLDLQYNSILFPGLIIIATLCYAISVNTIKRYLSDLPAIEITSFGLVIVGVPALIYTSFSSIPQRIIENPYLMEGIMYTAILALASTSLALILFNHLIKISTALFASSVTYLIPLVAVIWGILDGEKLVFLQLIGGFILIIGVYFVYKKKAS